MGIFRLLLALAVVAAHTTTHLSRMVLPGHVAVEAFFIISGFYIALILHRKYNFKGATWLFYQQRYLRLMPMYWLAVLSTVAACAFYSVIAHRPAGVFAVWSAHCENLSTGSLLALCTTHMTMLGLDGLMFCAFSGQPLSLYLTPHWTQEPLPAVRFMLVPPAWSLSVELMFYLCAPFIVRRSVRFQVSIVAMTFACRIAAGLAFGLPDEPWSNRFFPFEAGLFILGSLAYRCLTQAENLVQRYPISRVGTIALLGVTSLFYQFIHLPDEVRRWGFLVLVLFSVPLLFAATQRNAMDRWIGEMSYPLYLIHQVVLFSAEPILRRIGGFANDIASMFIPLAIAAVIYALIERPLELRRARRYHRKTELSEF